MRIYSYAPSHTKIILSGDQTINVVLAKEFNDFAKLAEIIKGYCNARVGHFHSVSNVVDGEIVFFKSALKNDIFVRGRAIITEREA